MTSPRTDLRWIRAPQQTRSQETLGRILDAAQVLVSEKGFEDTPVAEVVRRAGSSVGAFYTRFPDKDALLHALHDRFFDQAVATADSALDPARWEGATIAEVLDAVVRFLASIYREQSGLLRAFVIRNHTDPEFLARQARLSHYVTARLCALLLARADEIRHHNPERAARFGTAMIFSTLESAVLFGEMRSRALSISDDELATELTRAFLAYLGVEESFA